MTTCCDNAEAGTARYRCEKHCLEMCNACLKCKDPDLYCKFRSACMIQFLEKERSAGRRQKSEES